MTIAKKPAKTAAAFVSQGLTKTEAAAPAYAMVRFPKTQAHLLDEVRAAVEARKIDQPKTSQNDWLLEAITEKLQKGGL